MMDEPIKIYVASGYENIFLLKAQLEMIGNSLLSHAADENFLYDGHKVKFLHNWMKPPKFDPTKVHMDYPPELPTTFHEEVHKDFQEVDECDILLTFHPHFIGTLCEMSYALGRDKETIYCIDRRFMPDVKYCTDETMFSKFFPLGHDSMLKWDVNSPEDTNFWVVHEQDDLVECLEYTIRKVIDKRCES